MDRAFRGGKTPSLAAHLLFVLHWEILQLNIMFYLPCASALGLMSVLVSTTKVICASEFPVHDGEQTSAKGIGYQGTPYIPTDLIAPKLQCS